jgi:hypothetical protein
MGNQRHRLSVAAAGISDASYSFLPNAGLAFLANISKRPAY